MSIATEAPSTCTSHVSMLVCMSTLQVRNLSEETHRILKARAVEANQSLSDFVAGILDREASKLPFDQWVTRIRLREPVDPGESAARALAEEQGSWADEAREWWAEQR